MARDERTDLLERRQGNSTTRNGGLGYPGPGTWTGTTVRSRASTGMSLLTTVLIVAIAASYFIWEALHAAGYTYGTWSGLRVSDYDEAAYVVSAQLLRHGFALFSAVFSSQPALFLGSLLLGLKVLGNTVGDTVASHLVIGFYGALAVAGTAWAAWASYGRSGAVAAGVAAALTPAMILYGHTIEAEMPMIGVSMLALATAAWYYRLRNRWLLLATGLLLGLGVEMKLLAVVFLLPIVLFVLGTSFVREGSSEARWSTPQQRGSRDNLPLNLLVDMLLLALATLLPLVVVLGLFSPHQQYDQVVTFHLRASNANPLNRAANVRELRDMLLWDPGLLVVAVLGVVCALVRQRAVSGTIHALWFVVSLLFLWQYHPLISHQFSVLFPPLAILAGGAVSAVATARRHPLAAILGALAIIAWGVLQLLPLPTAYASSAPPQKLSTWQRTSGLLLGFAATTGGPLAPFMAHIAANETKSTPACMAAANAANHSLSLTSITFRALMRECLAGWTARHVKPWQIVVTDDLFVATIHNRLVPPQLCDPSIIRASAGYLTENQLESYTWYSGAKLVVIWRGLYDDPHYFAAYIPWLHRHFKEVTTGVPGSRAFMRPG